MTGYEYSGYESAFVPTPPGNTSSPNIETKTEKPSDKNPKKETDSFKEESKQVVVRSGQSNILNSYRSITYNFTLAALKSTEVNNPDSYRDSELELVILKSGGKGYSGLVAPAKASLAQQKEVQAEVYDKFDARAKAENTAKNVERLNSNNQSLVSGFNANSPGRFDLYIENIDIETLMAFTEGSNASLPCKVAFDVIEPYSVNGFIEALHISAVMAGYTNYLAASYILKMEFWGYPDGPGITDPVKIPNSERYFPIGLTGIEVDISDKGTRYKCSAVPYNERAFGQPSKLKKPIKMAGKTIKEILENLIENINIQVKRLDNEGKERSNPNDGKHDVYEIKFLNWDNTVGWIPAQNNLSKISESKLTHLYQDNNLYKLADPATVKKMSAYKEDAKKSDQSKPPEGIKFEPDKTVIQFPEDMNIYDIIISVIRDCEYIRNILKDIKSRIDEFGMLDYFMVRMEVSNQAEIDEVSKKPYQRYTYIVSPYRMHYTKIPGFGSQQIEESKLKKLSKREYNYIYTGQNVDVLNFKLNFNTLFFEAVPASMGNKDAPNTKNAAVPSNGTEARVTGSSVERQQANQVPLTPVKVIPSPMQYSGSNAAQPQDDPYSVLARNMHESIINSKASMITGEIEILGDPIYLATNGHGGYNGKPTGDGVTANGEANHLYGEILITINFRNPIDILPLENGGIAHFDANRVPFSGIYRVNKVQSTFKDGVFKQRLEVIRVPGQILDQNVRPTDPSAVITSRPSPNDAVVPDTSRAGPEVRFQGDVDQLGRGFPNPGLPGEPSNFANTPGGLAGANPLLERTYGLVGRSGALLNNSAQVGLPLPTDVASSIRLNTSGLAKLTQTNLGSAALVAIATNVLTGNLPTKRAIGAVAGGVIGGVLASSLKISNKGSGIGEGATLLVNKDFVPSSLATAVDQVTGKTINPSQLPVGSINEFTSNLKQLGSNAIDQVSASVKDAGKFVSGIGDKISKLTSSPPDPAAIGAKLGINTAAIAGQSLLPGKALTQISNLVKNVPADVNLPQAVESGLRLQSIPADKIKNIPATQLVSSAPAPLVETDYLKTVAAVGGVRALENLFGVTNVNKISSNMIPTDSLNSALASSFNKVSNNSFLTSKLSNVVDTNAIKDKISTAKQQLSTLTKETNIKDQTSLSSAVSKFGSSALSATSSPLDKLVNKFNSSDSSIG